MVGPRSGLWRELRGPFCLVKTVVSSKFDNFLELDKMNHLKRLSQKYIKKIIFFFQHADIYGIKLRH